MSIIIHRIVSNPDNDKMLEALQLENNAPLILYCVYNTIVNDSTGTIEFKYNNSSIYFYENHVKKMMCYNEAMLPTNYENIKNIFITNLLKI